MSSTKILEKRGILLTKTVLTQQQKDKIQAVKISLAL